MGISTWVLPPPFRFIVPQEASKTNQLISSDISHITVAVLVKLGGFMSLSNVSYMVCVRECACINTQQISTFKGCKFVPTPQSSNVVCACGICDNVDRIKSPGCCHTITYCMSHYTDPYIRYLTDHHKNVSDGYQERFPNQVNKVAEGTYLSVLPCRTEVQVVACEENEF